MGARRSVDQDWDDGGYDAESSYTNAYAGDFGDGSQELGAYDDDDERGLVLRTDDSLVGVSNIVTQHGTPILSYTRTMNRFYSSRKQRLSLLRHKCEVCGDRIRFWSFETPHGTHTHDGCYERLAWTWTNLYARQQQMAMDGTLD